MDWGFKKREKTHIFISAVFSSPEDEGFGQTVEEKQIMGTWGALGIPFPPCLSRKRQSWEHGHALAIPFPPACRGNGYHGIMACACDSLFPLPVEEKAIVGCLRFPFPLACRGKGNRGVPAIRFSPCQSRNRTRWTQRSTLAKAAQGLHEVLGTPTPSKALEMAFPSTGRGKGHHGLVCLRCIS